MRGKNAQGAALSVVEGVVHPQIGIFNPGTKGSASLPGFPPGFPSALSHVMTCATRSCGSLCLNPMDLRQFQAWFTKPCKSMARNIIGHWRLC